MSVFIVSGRAFFAAKRENQVIKRGGVCENRGGTSGFAVTLESFAKETFRETREENARDFLVYKSLKNNLYGVFFERAFWRLNISLKFVHVKKS